MTATKLGGLKQYLGGRYVYKAIVGLNDDGEPVITRSLSGKKYEQTADYICSAYLNENGQKVSYVIPLDIDAKDSAPEWFDSEGLDHEKILNLLQNDYPVIGRHILFMVRSKGGKGVHVGIAISPVVKDFSEKSRRAEFLGRQAQKNLIRLLRSRGLGADPAASGIFRDMPNWRRKKPCGLSKVEQLFFNPFIRAEIKRERLNVISDLLDATNKLPECLPVAKRDRDDVIHRSSKTEPGLAALYLHLFDNFGQAVYMGMGEIRRLTGLSKNTLRNVLERRPHTCPKWLKVRYISREEGYALWLDANFGSVERAEALTQGRCIDSEFLSDLPCPTEVIPGQRNRWIFSALIHFKWHGYAEEEALEATRSRAQLIPTFMESKSYRRLDQMAAHIYSSHPHTRGIRRGQELPRALSGDHFGRVKKLQQPRGGVRNPPQRVLRVSFTRKDKSLMAVAYDHKDILAETELKGRGLEAQLVAVQSLLSALTSVGKIIFTGKTWFQGHPIGKKFAVFHGLEFVFEEKSKSDEATLKRYRNPGLSEKKALENLSEKISQGTPRECFNFPEIRDVKVRLDGHFQYQKAFYWLGEEWSGVKLQVLVESGKVEAYERENFDLVKVFDLLEPGQQSPAEVKIPWERALGEDSVYRRRSRKVGPSFDALVLEAVRSGQGVVHTGRIMGYLSLLKSWPYEHLEAVALHCLKRGHRSQRYFRSCLEVCHE